MNGTRNSAHKSTELLKTKLMKLLNYSDMIFYKENGISISGVRYAHLPYGPVPENLDILLGTMAADHIAHIEIFYDNGYEKHQVIPEEDMPKGILSGEELAVLDRVYHKFANFGSADISNYSHKEKGYASTKKGEIISYAYAKDIELDSPCNSMSEDELPGKLERSRDHARQGQIRDAEEVQDYENKMI